jgi:hypothetical protein
LGIGRRELLAALGIIRDGPHVDPHTERAYRNEETRLWRAMIDDSERERGEPWHTSLHMSSFPGDEKSCLRSMLYGLMGVPEVEPISPLGRSVMHIGRALEAQIVYRWHREGLTVTGACPIYEGPEPPQTRFSMDEYWLTGSMDAALDLRPEWPYVLPIDVKGKDHEVVDKMRVGARSYDPEHYGQIQGYIHACRAHHEDMGWAAMGLKPAEGGVILYASRQRPRNTAEFYVPYDHVFATRALDNLKKIRAHFMANTLPERDASWRWTEAPCDWCPYKRDSCKPDTKAGVGELGNSTAIEFARSLQPTYDFSKRRKAVLERWKGAKNGS